jgi:hypothetical protein
MALPATRGGPSADEAGRNASAGQEQQDTVIQIWPLRYCQSKSATATAGTGLGALTTASLKRWVPIAVDRAIREIIQPVVERSDDCLHYNEGNCYQDFAMESDEAKMRKAGQLMVAAVGSLALVTCREPLRGKCFDAFTTAANQQPWTHRQVGEQEHVIEQCVQICATDNIELPVAC